MNRLILILKIGIGRAYYWFWNYLLCRRKPFTWQLTRMMHRHRIAFWLVFVGAQFAAYQAIDPPPWIALAWLAINAWLIDHLIEYLIKNPSEVSDL